MKLLDALRRYLADRRIAKALRKWVKAQTPKKCAVVAFPSAKITASVAAPPCDGGKVIALPVVIMQYEKEAA